MRFWSIALGLLLAVQVQPARGRVMDALDLFALGLEFGQSREELRGNRCLSRQEADGRNRAALGILGAVTGAVVAPALTGRPGSIAGGAADGAILGALGGRAILPEAQSAPAGREYAYLICQQMENGRRMRQPIIWQLIDEVGGACGVPRSRFNQQNPESGPDGAWRQLLECARRNPALDARVTSSMQALGAVNYSVCLSARSEIQLRNQELLARARANGGSYTPHPTPPNCTRETPETVWRNAYP